MPMRFNRPAGANRHSLGTSGWTVLTIQAALRNGNQKQWSQSHGHKKKLNYNKTRQKHPECVCCTKAEIQPSAPAHNKSHDSQTPHRHGVLAQGPLRAQGEEKEHSNVAKHPINCYK